MIKDFTSGATAYGKAFSYISRFGLWGYVLVPGLISLLLGFAIFRSAWALSGDVGKWLVSWYPFSWGSETLGEVASVFGGIFVLAIGFIIFKHLVMIIASPFMSFLSEKIEKKIYGGTAKTPTFQMILSDLARGVQLALRNIFRELLFTLLLFLAGLIPIFSPFVPFLIFLVQAYYAGFANMDYTLERYYRVNNSVKFVRQNKGLALGNGTVFMLLLFTGIGFLIALPLGTVAATTETLKRIKH